MLHRSLENEASDVWGKGPFSTNGAAEVAEAPCWGAGVARSLGPSMKKQMGNFTGGL